MDNLPRIDQQTAFSSNDQSLFAGYFDEQICFYSFDADNADDAGLPRDENTLDTPPIAYQPDSGKPDCSQPDGGQPDGGQPDGGQPDGGQPDGGQPDGGQPDGGQPNYGQPDFVQQSNQDALPTNTSIAQTPDDPNKSDHQLDSHLTNGGNCVAPVGDELDAELENLDLKSLKNFFYAENDETFLDDYLSNYESDLKPETLNDYLQSSGIETNEDCQSDRQIDQQNGHLNDFQNDRKEQERSSLVFQLDDFIRNELVGVTEDFELNYELDAFQLPAELNEQLGKECPPPSPSMELAGEGKPARGLPKSRNQTKPKKLIQCNLCLYTSPDKNKIKRHYLTHTKAKPFRCAVCGSSFSQSGALKTHFNRSHKDVQFIYQDIGRPTFGGFEQSNGQFRQMNPIELRPNVESNQKVEQNQNVEANQNALNYQANHQLSYEISNLANCQMNLITDNPNLVSGNPNMVSGNPNMVSNQMNYAMPSPITNNSMSLPTNSFGQHNRTYQFSPTNPIAPASFHTYPCQANPPNYQFQSDANLNPPYPMGNQVNQTSQVFSNNANHVNQTNRVISNPMHQTNQMTSNQMHQSQVISNQMHQTNHVLNNHVNQTNQTMMFNRMPTMDHFNQTPGQFGHSEPHGNYLTMVIPECCSKIFDFMYT